jgi:hypothetical protein
LRRAPLLKALPALAGHLPDRGIETVPDIDAGDGEDERRQRPLVVVARRLGIGRSTLYRKLKEYGIDPVTGRG